MAKALKIIGTVVAVVGLAATGIGLAIGGAAAAGSAVAGSATFLGIAGTTWATIGTIASLVGAGLAIVSAIAFKPSFSQAGNPTRFTTNPQSGIPYCIGRTRMSGLRVHADTASSVGSDKQDILGFAVMLSGGGQIDALESFTADNQTVTFNSTTGAASSPYTDWMSQKTWLGGSQTSALALTLKSVNFPGWTTDHKLSGITHALWMMRHDPDGNMYGAGMPEPAWIGRWVRVYDPRLDSTYPGGSGSCRALQEDTYVWSRNPALHALTWALGRWQNGKKTFGIGAPVNTIRVADFVEAANVADTNKWYCGGVEYSTDSKWDILKRMLQAGGAIPTMTGAMIGCRAYAPRVSVTTVTSDDLMDSLSFAATKPQRDRFNTVIPRYRSEAHEWEIISGSPITVSAYVTADGRVRQKEYDLPLVQHEVAQTNVDGNRQAGQLAAYEIVESREAGPISFTTGPKFLGLKSGDCVTLDVPDEGFSSTKIMIIEPPKFDPVSGKISFLGQTETDSKHSFALSESTTPPLSFSLTPPALKPAAPLLANWSLTAGLNGDGSPVIRLSGGTAGGTFWDAIIVQYKKSSSADWIENGSYFDTTSMKLEIIVDGNVNYDLRLAYKGAGGYSDWLTLGPVSVPLSQIVSDIASAQNSADAAYVLADSKIETYYQTTMPSGASIGDLWFDTDDGNKLYRHNGTTFIDAQDDSIATAITAAAGAQATADGKVTTFFQASAPTAEAIGDLWMDSDDKNKMYRWSGSAWVSTRDAGKVTTFYATSAPTAEAIGDLWYNSSTLVQKRWDGSAWVDTATNGAPSGTAVGGLASDTVATTIKTDGVINTDKVNTASIQSNSVNSIATAYSSGSVSTTTNGATLAIQTVSITSTGSTILVNASSMVRVQVTSGSIPTAVGVTIWVSWSDNVGNSGNLVGNMSPTFVHTTNVSNDMLVSLPAVHTGTVAGRTYTYTLNAQFTNANIVGISGLNNRIMTAQEVKR